MLIGACMQSVSHFFPLLSWSILTNEDYPYENIEEGQEWWRNIDLGSKEKELVARENAIRLFKLPLEL